KRDGDRGEPAFWSQRSRSFVAPLLRMRRLRASFTPGLNGSDRPLVFIVSQRDVEVARLRLSGNLHGPRRSDLVLPLGALFRGALEVEGARLHASEETVEEVRRLVAAVVVPVLFDESGELQPHLVALADSCDDRLRVAAAEAARQVRHCHVEVLEL